ncbi:MAG: hypothetical protein QOD06_730 [Candidatus Binatota bacterium]|jgi:hypothetical protein|nr:hypothetical protein [Candidatus Binatota bacterium]
MKRSILPLALASFSLATGPVAAEEPAPQKKPPAASATAPGKPSAADVRLKETQIRGELEKPKIFFILPKAERETASDKRRLRFYPDILEPIDKDRFEEEARVLYQHGIPAE